MRKCCASVCVPSVWAGPSRGTNRQVVSFLVLSCESPLPVTCPVSAHSVKRLQHTTEQKLTLVNTIVECFQCKIAKPNNTIISVPVITCCIHVFLRSRDLDWEEPNIYRTSVIMVNRDEFL